MLSTINSLSTALTKMVNMQGSFRYGAGVYQLAIDLVAQGKIDLKPLISHQYAFKDAKEAFQCMIDNKGHDGKPPIKCEWSRFEQDVERLADGFGLFSSFRIALQASSLVQRSEVLVWDSLA